MDMCKNNGEGKVDYKNGEQLAKAKSGQRNISWCV